MKINKILTAGLVCATLVIGFTGCVSEPLPAKKISIRDIGAIEQKYIFNGELSKERLSKNNIIYNLMNQMSKNSNYSSVRREDLREYGKDISYKDNILRIEYINGDKHTSGTENLTKVIFKLPFKITEKSKNIFLLNIKFPINYDVKPFTDAIGLEIKPLDKLSNLENDAIRLFNVVKKPITIKRNLEFKGEINTKYPDKAVYANFKRILGNYSWSDNEKINDVKKQNTFTLKVNDKLYPLYIEVYPYRDGSKVVYSTTLRYVIDSKGGSTLNAKDVKALHKKIEDIVNN